MGNRTRVRNSVCAKTSSVDARANRPQQTILKKPRRRTCVDISLRGGSENIFDEAHSLVLGKRHAIVVLLVLETELVVQQRLQQGGRRAPGAEHLALVRPDGVETEDAPLACTCRMPARPRPCTHNGFRLRGQGCNRMRQQGGKDSRATGKRMRRACAQARARVSPAGAHRPRRCPPRCCSCSRGRTVSRRAWWPAFVRPPVYCAHETKKKACAVRSRGGGAGVHGGPPHAVRRAGATGDQRERAVHTAAGCGLRQAPARCASAAIA